MPIYIGMLFIYSTSVKSHVMDAPLNISEIRISSVPGQNNLSSKKRAVFIIKCRFSMI